MDELPVEMIQHILSFLSPEEAAQTIVFSKTWLLAWSTYPNFDIRQGCICRKLGGRKFISKQVKEKFAKFMDDNLLRYSKPNLPINKFSLNLTFFDCELPSRLHKWLGMVVDMGVKHLNLKIKPSKTTSIPYNLPPLILASRQLTSLSILLGGFRTSPTIAIRFPLIKCCNLKTLFLQSVHLDDRTFQKICSSCPLIEHLSLDECLGLKNIQVSNIRNLFYLRLTNIHNQIKGIALERVHVSSQTLQCLIFYQCLALEAKIDAPNLLVLSYASNRIPSFSFKFSLSEQFNSKICILPNYDLDTLFLVKFKDFLTKLNHCESYLDVNISSENIWFDIEDLREIQLPPPQPKIRKLKISLSRQSLTNSTLVDGLLWSCHPETLEVCFPSETDYEFIKFLCMELIDRTCLNCCTSSDQVLCWRHYLNHVAVEYSEGGVDDWKPFDWKSLVDGSMIPSYCPAIRYTLNW